LSLLILRGLSNPRHSQLLCCCNCTWRHWCGVHGTTTTVST